MAATEHTVVTPRVPVIDLGAAADASVLASIRSAIEAIGVIQVVNHGVPLDLIAYLGRPWAARPSDDPELRDLTFRSVAAGQALAERVLDRYARALSLPGGTFPVDPLPHLSLHHGATGIPVEPDEDSVLTVLAQADGHPGAPGLHVQSPDSGWLPVPPVAGALTVLSGSLLARWTGGRLHPARYRMTAGAPVARLSYPALGRVPGPLGPFAEPSARWDLVAEYLGVFGCPARLAALLEVEHGAQGDVDLHELIRG